MLSLSVSIDRISKRYGLTMRSDPAFPDRALALADLDYWDSV
jgi:hypothetical protein